MAKRSDMDHGLLLLIVALLAWAVPGAGHFFIKEQKRALIIFITITSLFLVGIYVGSIAVIDPVGAWPWYVGQMLASPAIAIFGHATRSGKLECFGRPHDVGQIYTAIAGGLNLLCMLSAVYMAHSGRGEMIGEEEDEQ